MRIEPYTRSMIVMKPPMGWNTWNTFGLDISEELIFQTADEMVSGGYRDAGYEYLVIDDGWAEKERGADGSLVPDRTKFPHGMKAVADYVHKKGLKFGIYSCARVRTSLSVGNAAPRSRETNSPRKTPLHTLADAIFRREHAYYCGNSVFTESGS